MDAIPVRGCLRLVTRRVLLISVWGRIKVGENKRLHVRPESILRALYTGSYRVCEEEMGVKLLGGISNMACRMQEISCNPGSSIGCRVVASPPLAPSKRLTSDNTATQRSSISLGFRPLVPFASSAISTSRLFVSELYSCFFLSLSGGILQKSRGPPVYLPSSLLGYLYHHLALVDP
jgi:hypothetical protein